MKTFADCAREVQQMDNEIFKHQQIQKSSEIKQNLIERDAASFELTVCKQMMPIRYGAKHA